MVAAGCLVLRSSCHSNTVEMFKPEPIQLMASQINRFHIQSQLSECILGCRANMIRGVISTRIK
jgi:hypothetical protein